MTRDDDYINKRLGGKSSVWNTLQYDRDGIIEASAGTGKTYALQSIVLKLVSDKLHPVDAKNILLVTFTEKAAGELKDRIRDILDKAGVLPPDFDEATICTIHSFCRELLSEYAFENRVPMQMDIGGTNGDLIHRAVREVLLGNDFRQRYGELYETYITAAGLGSTDDLVAVAESLLKACADSDQPPAEPQRLDNGVKATMRDIVGRLCPSGDYGHLGEASGISNLPFNGNDRAAFGSDFADFVNVAAGLMSRDEKTFMTAVMKCGEIRGRGKNRLNPRISKPYACRLGEHVPAIGEMITAIDAVSSTLSVQLASDLAYFAWPVFKRMKEDAAMLTFDDLVTQAYRVIKQESEREEAGAHSALMDSIRHRYRIALVDEFQDTDQKQWAIFSKLFSSRVNRICGDDAPDPKQGFLLVVGDPKQAIYGFRGADVAMYLAAKREITGGEAPPTLDETYRSTKPLVQAFKTLFGESGWFADMTESGSRIDYKEVSYPEGNERFIGLEDLTGRDAVTLLESLPFQLPDIVSNRGVSGYGNTARCLPVFMRNAAFEMKRLVTLPVAYRTTDPKSGAKVDHRIRYGDICILVRGKSDANVGKRILAEYGIPYSCYKERGIYGSAEAEALIALFDFLSAPGRVGNLAALLLTPLFSVHPSDLETKTANGGGVFSDLAERWQELTVKREWNALFESVMTDTMLAHPRKDDYEYDRRWAAFRQILDRLLVEKGRSAVMPGEFADLLRSWRKNDQRAGEDGALRQKENESDSVQIMTMHASKGLEFKAAFVAAGFSRIEDDSLDEEKRLYYVALTRAEHKLYLPWTKWGKHLRVGTEEFGIGSKGAPLLGEGFLSKAIRTYSVAPTVLDTRTVCSASGTGNGNVSSVPVACPPFPVPSLYDIGYLKQRRLQWDSFTSLNQHGGAEKVVPTAVGEVDETAAVGVSAQQVRKTLLPRNNVSGNVFHEIMETLCGNDEAAGKVGFAIGKESLETALADDGPLVNLVRHMMRRNALGNQTRDGDSTERTLARMAWRALNTRIEIGGRKMFLRDISFEDRLAEVEFVMDEASVLGADTPRLDGVLRDGAFNGKIDLLIRPDGKDGPVYVLDWKTNTLDGYDEASVGAAMEAAGYPLQFKLYSLAVARWLGREALAGVAYLFVRGGEYGEASGVFAQAMNDTAFADCRQKVLAAVPKGV